VSRIIVLRVSSPVSPCFEVFMEEAALRMVSVCRKWRRKRNTDVRLRLSRSA
jgi:hypothetical protein